MRIGSLSPPSLLATVLLVTVAVDSLAQSFLSADAARDLVYALDASGLHAIAAADPEEPGRFVAALYIPGSQLLVVSARHPSVEGLGYRISMRQYREAYLDLQGSPTPEGKVFVQDAGADGILSVLPGSGDVDVLYEDGVRQTLFNGDIEAQHFTSAEYNAKLATADARYDRLLKLLIAAVHQGQKARDE
jgi:hypothetical protein